MVNSPQLIRVLLVDDDEDDYVLTRELLEDITTTKFELDWERNYQEGLDRILKNGHDIYLVDYRLGENVGISLIKEAIDKAISAPIILLTGKGDKNIDLQAMEEGAADFLVKGEITSDMLERSIRYAVKNAEALRQVRENENKFRQLFEKSIDVIYVSDKQNRIVEINDSVFSVFGFVQEDVQGSLLSTLFRNEEDYLEFIHILEAEKQVKDFEVDLVSKTGEIRICQIAAVQRTNDADEFIGYQGIIHDLTMRKMAEKELLLAERLSMTGRIARSIAHEVRNPLTNLGLALDQLKDELPEENEDVSLYFDIIKRNAGRIDQLITEMLKSSRPKELNYSLMDINEVTEKSIELVKDRITLKGMALEMELEDGLDMVPVDFDKMQMALVNILVNAIEAMEEDTGRLVLRTGRSQNGVAITIMDNGGGIAEEDIKKLFDPFYTNKHGGMGLGLTTTQSIIHSHGGTIEVKSRLEEGTMFYITIPKNKKRPD